MMLIFNNLSFAKALEDMHYDAQALPLGKLGKKTLQTGMRFPGTPVEHFILCCALSRF